MISTRWEIKINLPSQFFLIQFECFLLTPFTSAFHNTMKFSTATAFLTLALPANTLACPGSSSKSHQSCEMAVTFADSCHEVRSEVFDRLQGSEGWTDPHDHGMYNKTYPIVAGGPITGSRVTVEGKYTDLFDFTFSDFGSGCKVTACSESQFFALTDYSTNYCNLHNLYCSSEDGCRVLNYDLHYTEVMNSCQKHDQEVCIPRTKTPTVSPTPKPTSSPRPTPAADQDSDQCAEDVAGTTYDITLAIFKVKDLKTDCADGFTKACNKGFDDLLADLTGASNHINDALYSCASSAPSQCIDDINTVITDLNTGITDVSDALIDCSNFFKTKCVGDVTAAAKDLKLFLDDTKLAISSCAGSN